MSSSNKDLSERDFAISINIKRALNAISNSENPLEAKGFLYAALREVHG